VDVDERSLRKVSRGLLILYASIDLVALLILLLMLWTSSAKFGIRVALPSLSTLGSVVLGVLVVFPLLNVIGRALCYFNTPAVGAAKSLVTACAALDAISLLLVFANLLIVLPRGEMALFYTAILGSFDARTSSSLPTLTVVPHLLLISLFLFLLYLRWLADYTQTEGLTWRATLLFVVGLLWQITPLALRLAGIGGVLGLVRDPRSVVIVGVIYNVGIPLLLLIVYVRLLLGLRRAIRESLE